MGAIDIIFIPIKVFKREGFKVVIGQNIHDGMLKNLPRVVCVVGIHTTKTRVFRLRFFGPRFKKRGPKLHKAPFFKNGA